MMLLKGSSVILQLPSVGRCLSVIKEPDGRSPGEYAIILFCFLSLIPTSETSFGKLSTKFLQR
ncbi:hypothetical protein T4A_2526 [Trichinella pseudospiralis]|uniref:Uncharacterized protein n=1 Tax=Trichinella pseudospiralis TaxID=6337 RepID=A0A0V1EG68_TRIPS|nr:hypothetical protein T4E_5537 [Trichinella pseudospiralis]KRY72450.1 hypothetical protein T4A_2526 [Trichinella pseudospiralis]KRY83544.1 hypothetical protein T4D_9939 [Trichinella pseudospiralis]KRZ31057.1 hypothetical protein T4C_2424 [Trichinella pseudospiralis]